jgi:predicted cupin superfamily sugar epimerase
VLTPEQLIEHFGLEPLPVEGGLFFQTYISTESIDQACLPDRYERDKPFGTAIVYLLTPDPNSFSAMHRLPTDEVYHFYMGDPVELLQLYPDGRSERIIMGHDLLNGQRIQHVAPRGAWQGSHLLPGGTWALIGTTMAPGFTNDDYFGGDRDELIARYTDQAELITQLTRPHDSRRHMP